MDVSHRAKNQDPSSSVKTDLFQPRLTEFLLNFSIGQRLIFSFVAAALISALMIGAIGLQRVQVLQSQSEFYQDLVQTSNALQNGRNILLLMDKTIHIELKDAAANISQETIGTDQYSVQNLAMHYIDILTDYRRNHVLSQHSTQMQLLIEANHQALDHQQQALIGSAFRTWQLYQPVQEQISRYVLKNKMAEAQLLEHLQGEKTFADALSAFQALVRFNETLTSSVQDITNVQERNQLIMTISGALLACVGIALAGLLIFNTFVQRIKQIRTAAQSVERGNLDTRLTVRGRDEIAAVAGSVNAMVQAMVAEAIAHEQQRQLNQFKDQFIMNVSHELRTPLTQVYGFLELLIDYHGQLDPSKQLTFLQRAKYGCQELIYLVNSVLDATRATTDMAAPRITQVAVFSLVQEVIDSLDPRQKQDYRLEMLVPDSIVVLADRQYLRQIVRNLASNALKYTPPQTTISFIAEMLDADQDSKPMVRICVKDTGPGIPPDEISHLFQRFARLERDVSGTVRGTGLGLYVCKQLVEAMNGQIWVESSGIAGEGSYFYFTLPASPVHNAASVLPPEQRSIQTVS